MTDKYQFYHNNINMLVDDMRDGLQRVREAQQAIQIVINDLKSSTDLTEIEKIGLASHATLEIGKIVKNDLHSR